MAQVNQEGLLGSLIPSVYIKRIILETSGHNLVERNPHIDHEREPGLIRNEETGKIERQEIDSDLLRKNDEDSETLNVTLELVMKERLDKGMISSWFSEQDFLKYLKIHILQSTYGDLTNLYATKRLSLTSFGEKEISETGIEHKHISVDDVLDDSSLNQKISYVDNDGVEVYDVVFRVRFSLNGSNPEHLAYFALAYLDLEELAKDFELDLPQGADKILSGAPTSEIAINEKKIVSESYVFLDEQGKIWTGPVNQTNTGEWKTGEENTEESKKIELTTISNSKIQDFRIFKRVERLQLDFSIIENKLFSPNSRIKFNTNDNLNLLKNKNYFSDFLISRDIDGNVRFAFGLDYENLIRDNTRFGSFYVDQNQELLEENVKIRTITLMRARVKGDGFELKDERGLRIFDENEEPIENIIVSGENEPGSFVEKITENGSLKELVPYFEEEIPGIRYFTGIDKTMDTVTFGKYQYGIEVEIEDRTASYFLGELDELLFSLQILNEYYSECVLSENYDVSTNQFKQNFVDEQERKWMGEEENAPWVLPISKYLSTMDILIEQFDRREFEEQFVFFVHPRSGNPSGVSTVISLIERLIRRIDDVIKSSRSGKINKFITGQSQWKKQSIQSHGSTPLKTFKISKFFPDIFDSDIPKTVGYDFFSTGEEPKGTPNDDGLIVISNSKYKERIEKETLKYFKNTDSDISIKTEKIEYTANDNIDNTKYAYLTPASVRMGDRLKPVSFLEKGEGVNNIEKYKKLSANLIRYKNSFRSPYVPFNSERINLNSRISRTEQSVRNNLTNIFADKSLLVLNPKAQEKLNKSETSETSTEDVKIIGARKFFGSGSNFLTEDRIKKEIVGTKVVGDIEEDNNVNANKLLLRLNFAGDKKNKFIKKEKDTIRFWDIKNKDNALDLKFIKKGSVQDEGEDVGVIKIKDNTPTVSKQKQDWIKRLPNQIKSLLISSTKQNLVLKNWFEKAEEKDPLRDPEEMLVFNMSYKILNKIEVLTGFDNFGEVGVVRGLKNPIWQTLTLDLFNRSLDKNLICRLKEFEEKDLGIKRPKELSLPIYNEYFILSPENTIVKPNPPPRPKKIEKTKRMMIKLSNEQTVVRRPEHSKTLIIAKHLNVEKNFLSGKTSGPTIKPIEVNESPARVSQRSEKRIKDASFISKVARFRLR